MNGAAPAHGPPGAGLLSGRLILAALLVGALGAGTAVLVRVALDLGLHALYGVGDVTVGLGGLEPALRVLAPALGGLLGGGAAWLFARRGAQGVADVMEAVAVGRGRPRLRHAIGPALGSVLAALGGGSIGREGPLIQLGAAVGDLVGHPPPRPWRARGDRALPRLPPLTERERRALVAAGTAAGFAAAYNTPLAAILFVLEVMLGVVTLDVLIPVAIATAVGTALTRALVGGGPIYGVRDFTFETGAELFAFAAVGVLAALGGLGFTRLLQLGERLFERLGRLLTIRNKPLPRPFRAMLGGLIVGLVALAMPAVAGNGYEPIHWILDGRVPWLTLLLIALAKAVATTASVASGSPGGVFTPTMLIGASTGAGLAMALSALELADHTTLGGYALVGMAAAVAATTHAPLMASVLAFELSADYAIVLPLLLATGIATLLSRRLSRDSMYTAELRRRGIPTEATLGQRVAHGVRAREIMEPVPALVPADTPLADALLLLGEGRGRLLYVVGEGPLRAISLTAAKTYWLGLMRGAPLPPGTTAGDVARPIDTARPDDSLVALGEKLFSVDWGELPVVDPAAPHRPLGVVTRRGLLGAFDRELLQRDALMTRLTTSSGDGGFLELPDGHRAVIVPAPAWLAGRPADPGLLRERYGATLIAVRQDPGGDTPPRWIDPDPEVRVAASDRLLLVATADEIARLSEPPDHWHQ